jgi:hypothetical protein
LRVHFLTPKEKKPRCELPRRVNARSAKASPLGTWNKSGNRGVEARLLFARGDWLQIELAGGEVGWVPRRLVLVDET